MRINSVEVVKQFVSGDGATCGVYKVEVNIPNEDETQIFIRNGESIGIVAFYWDEPASKCVSIVRDDIAKEFLQVLEENQNKD